MNEAFGRRATRLAVIYWLVFYFYFFWAGLSLLIRSALSLPNLGLPSLVDFELCKFQSAWSSGFGPRSLGGSGVNWGGRDLPCLGSTGNQVKERPCYSWIDRWVRVQGKFPVYMWRRKWKWGKLERERVENWSETSLVKVWTPGRKRNRCTHRHTVSSGIRYRVWEVQEKRL